MLAHSRLPEARVQGIVIVEARGCRGRGPRFYASWGARRRPAGRCGGRSRRGRWLTDSKRRVELAPGRLRTLEQSFRTLGTLTLASRLLRVLRFERCESPRTHGELDPKQRGAGEEKRDARPDERHARRAHTRRLPNARKRELVLARGHGFLELHSPRHVVPNALELGRADPLESCLFVEPPLLLRHQSRALPGRGELLLLESDAHPRLALRRSGALSFFLFDALTLDARLLLRHQRFEREK